MVDVERSLLYVGLGFFVGMFMMARFRALRPVDITVSSASVPDDERW